jgi:hypothetical protein
LNTIEAASVTRSRFLRLKDGNCARHPLRPPSH